MCVVQYIVRTSQNKHITHHASASSAHNNIIIPPVIELPSQTQHIIGNMRGTTWCLHIAVTCPFLLTVLYLYNKKTDTLKNQTPVPSPISNDQYFFPVPTFPVLNDPKYLSLAPSAVEQFVSPHDYYYSSNDTHYLPLPVFGHQSPIHGLIGQAGGGGGGGGGGGDGGGGNGGGGGGWVQRATQSCRLFYARDFFWFWNNNPHLVIDNLEVAQAKARAIKLNKEIFGEYVVPSNEDIATNLQYIEAENLESKGKTDIPF